MQSFISETLDDILKSTTSFENVVFVLPSQRAGVFVKNTLKDKISTGFLPQILNIEQFVSEISEIKKIDSIQLLFHFYAIYKEIEGKPDSFDVFSSWAITVLQDFNEVDQHLINSKEIFIYLRDIERLRKWSVKGTFKETELMKDHYSFMEKLGEYYTAFYQFLINNKKGYQGVLYREATNKVAGFIEKNIHKKFFFIGFNALNKSEEFLFQRFLETGKSQVYWDIDISFLKSNHQAGNFIRKYKSKWKYYEKNALKIVGNNFSTPKNIQVIGASKNITQVKHSGEILQNFSNHNNTALVLADETLLPITLNSLPKNVEAINITMGYPLKDIPTSNLIFAVFQLFLTQDKLQKSASNQFYYKDVLRFIKHANIYKLFSEQNIAIDVILDKTIIARNSMFVDVETIESISKKLTNKEVLLSIFNPFNGISDFLERIINLINLIKENTTDLEKEYLYRFYTAFRQLQNLHSEFHFIQDLKTLHQFFIQLIQSESLSFQGEPLQGLQLMGMLETRVLDFENVIITSVNEGILPANSKQNSFIPFDVKTEFNLPTYREKDAIFSYHFFRLIQRAKNIFILYNTENDAFGGGEKSRFITQLEMMNIHIDQKIVSPKVVSSSIDLKEFKKNEEVSNRLKELAEKGLSPSAITNYLYNPIAFYKQKILKIKEFEDVEETVAVNTMGTVVHETLEELYKPFIGRFLTFDDVSAMQKKVKNLVEKHFAIQFKNGDLKTGKNRLIFEVANRFVVNFLKQESAILKDEKNTLKIIATEQNLKTDISIDGIDFPIKIHGQVDRIDELNGVTRIIDYKTGMVKASDLKITDFTSIQDYKYNKSIQVLLYAFLYTQNENYDFNTPLEAGIISFKNLKSGFLKMNFSSNYRTPDNLITQEKLDEFMEEIKSLILEIYNPEISFKEPLELAF
ncbi:PD-(D/E)XK nuclease superfamily protein [Lutibacter sp. Hel_I_33_5]|uniref:PD-(D/E)XK nuclease family protein n=1 Tax=Lutibacter sp. Hel_I_33_5 TaxID=1566289 RepID=UPI0011A23957|nr:PD-(D/E)XK nuclease family protein [Lutibacter sp. Hel_I_33_5]TVZ56476.1 PD-(D/E)XK nuclease superfamily protein [Lutibacter sp. Hel_I_33_5]